MIHYNKAGKSKIVYCVLNNLHECDNLTAKDMSINSIDFIIRGLIKKEHDILIGNSETELLRGAASKEFTHAVLITTGTYLWMGDRLFNEVERICEQDFFVAGHVLNRGDFYLELHKQFYIMNLAEYRELGSPIVEEGAWFVDDYHEEFVPVISSFRDSGEEVIQHMTMGTEKKNYQFKLHGWNILKLALEHNKKTIDVGTSIRTAKKYLYHEYEHVFVNEYPKIFHQQLFARNVVTPWNSDIIHTDLPFDGPVEQYITLGTGLNWIRNLNLVGYTPNTKVIFTDINHNCLRYMKELVETWDGIDYDKFYHAFEQFFPSGVPENVFHQLSARKEFDEFKQLFPNWQETWDTIKKLSFDYVLIDYTAEYDLSWIDPNKKTLINFSDLFNHAPLTPLQSVKFKIGAENRLVDRLNKVNPEITILFSSRAASGFKEYTTSLIGKVKDFEFTRLEELKMLPWHEHDWKTVGRRPLGL